MSKSNKEIIFGLSAALITGTPNPDAKAFNPQESIVQDLIKINNETIKTTNLVNPYVERESREKGISDSINNLIIQCLNDQKFVMMCNALNVSVDELGRIIYDNYDILKDNMNVTYLTKFIFDSQTNLYNRAGEELYNFFLMDEVGKTILKYSIMYRIDPLLMYGLFSQESDLNHNAHLPGGKLYTGAIGIGQHEKTTLGTQYVAHNFATNSVDTFVSDSENLLSLDNNVKATTMRIQGFIQMLYNGNIQITLMNYNFGTNRCDDVVETVAKMNGITMEQVINSCDEKIINDIYLVASDLSHNPSAYFNATYASYGDPNYVKNIVKRITAKAPVKYLEGKIDKENNMVVLLDITNPDFPKTVITTYDEYKNNQVDNLSYVKELVNKK